MGGGKSDDLFSGTKGAKAMPIADTAQPLRRHKKSSSAEGDSGYGAAGMNETAYPQRPRKKTQMGIDFILMVIERYLSGELSEDEFIAWLREVCTSPRFILAPELAETLIFTLRELESEKKEDGRFDTRTFENVLLSLKNRLLSIK